MLKKIVQEILDIFFPPNEIEKILRKISIETIFNKCAKNYEINNTQIHTIFKYKDPFIKDAIYEIKNNKNKNAINLFSKILLDEIINYIEENIISVEYKIPITWIPQHKSTFKEKGYNQGQELAAALCAAAPFLFEFQNILIKSKKTKPQHLIKNRKERLKNLKDVFEINKEKKFQIKNKTIILIDDVYTTGATLLESRQTLLNNGAKKVICFTIAH